MPEETTSSSSPSAPDTGSLGPLGEAILDLTTEPLGVLVDAIPSLGAAEHAAVVQIQDALDRLRLFSRHLVARHSAPLTQNIAEQLQLEKVLRALASSASVDDPEPFYRQCTRALSEIYGCRYAFIGRLQPAHLSVRTLAVWAGDDFAENFEYELDGTPCQDVLRHTKQLIPTGAAGLYPDDEMLIEMGVDSYFGAPLVSASGELLGLVSVMDTAPLHPDAWTHPILSVFATRIATEIERRHSFNDLITARHALQTTNEELESRVQERTAKLRREVDERRALEAQREEAIQSLEQRNAELRQFTYAVTHDLKSPLITIDGFLSLLSKSLDEGDSQATHRHAERIRSASGRMGQLLHELLELASIGLVKSDAEELAMSEVATEAVKLLSGAIREHGVLVEVNPNMPQALAVRSRILQVFQNLIDNAIKFMGSQNAPKIEIGFQQAEDNRAAFYWVRDNGPGIPPRFHERIFGLFDRLDATTSGTGVGLAIVKRVIEVHAGCLWVESDGHQGSTFCFTLPSPAQP